MEITGTVHKRGIALLRVLVGIIFLWAGVEKFTAAEKFDAAGFLKFATNGTLGWPFVSGEVAEGTVFNPTHQLWVSLADSGLMPVVNGLVVFGEIAIGVALILGLFTRFAGAMGTLMMLFFFVAAWDFAYGIVNQHLTYALICATITGLGAGKYYGLDGIVGASFPAGFRKWFMSGDVTETPAATPQPVPA